MGVGGGRHGGRESARDPGQGVSAAPTAPEKEQGKREGEEEMTPREGTRRTRYRAVPATSAPLLTWSERRRKEPRRQRGGLSSRACARLLLGPPLQAAASATKDVECPSHLSWRASGLLPRSASQGPRPGPGSPPGAVRPARRSAGAGPASPPAVGSGELWPRSADDCPPRRAHRPQKRAPFRKPAAKVVLGILVLNDFGRT